MSLEFTILGSGSSAGVPRADGNWGVCDPNEPKNHRSRCSMLVRRLSGEGAKHDTTALIDTAPDFRLQSVRAGIGRLDAVLMTHDHADQAHGLDDVRAFALIQRQRIPVHMDKATQNSLTRRFSYIFKTEGGYPAICDDHLIPPHATPWSVKGPSGEIPIITFDQDHGSVRSVGYRMGDVAYSSDVVDLDPAAFAALEGVKVWIVDALRYLPHPTHAHVDKALEWIAKLRPERAILTNLHLDLDYNELARRLPDGVEVGYDGLRFEMPL
jgi:phosphoribosyl 1,2-cyclic phosphate phosphodiesterase